MSTVLETDTSAYNDEFGPAKIVHLWSSSVNLRAIVVIDNIAAGPAIGGARMAPAVSDCVVGSVAVAAAGAGRYNGARRTSACGSTTDRRQHSWRSGHSG